MKKYACLALIAATLALTACASKKEEKTTDYSYEQKAPYGNERTVGDSSTHKADSVFKAKQAK